MFGGSPGQSTLVKRGPRDSVDDEGSSNQPSKRVKVEAGSSDIDGDIKKSMEKGTLSKVSFVDVYCNLSSSRSFSNHF